MVCKEGVNALNLKDCSMQAWESKRESELQNFPSPLDA